MTPLLMTGALIGYFMALALCCILLARMWRKFAQQGRKWGEWLSVGLLFLLVLLHWSWPHLLQPLIQGHTP